MMNGHKYNQPQAPNHGGRGEYSPLTDLIFFSPLMYNHTTSRQLYYKYLQTLHAKYALSAKTTELNLRNTTRKTLDKNAMLALSLKHNTFVC